MNIDLLIHNARLLTCTGQDGPKRDAAMRDVGLIDSGALAIHDGTIVALGRTSELEARYDAALTIDAHSNVVCPGFVDPHTHVVYAGDRIDEFEQRIQGATYLEIMARGGGITSTTRATRAASLEQLIDQTRRRLDRMLAQGTTTVEAKSGYGLELAAELKQLDAIAALDRTHPIELVPTFLGAHALPPEYGGRTDAYVDLLVGEMLPAVVAWYRGSHFAGAGVPLFVDVFCEQNAFDVAQSRRVMEAAHAHGLPLKAHVDEFSALGGLQLALELGATSVDHLDVTAEAGIKLLARSTSVGVVIPTVPFNFGASTFAAARAMIDAGAAIALTTDNNPGSAPCPSLPLAMAIACRYQRLLPAEALNAVTLNAAHALGLGSRIGSLERGKQADVLILDTADYRDLMYEFGANHVHSVIKRGVVVR